MQRWQGWYISELRFKPRWSQVLSPKFSAKCLPYTKYKHLFSERMRRTFNIYFAAPGWRNCSTRYNKDNKTSMTSPFCLKRVLLTLTCPSAYRNCTEICLSCSCKSWQLFFACFTRIRFKNAQDSMYRKFSFSRFYNMEHIMKCNALHSLPSNGMIIL